MERLKSVTLLRGIWCVSQLNVSRNEMVIRIPEFYWTVTACIVVVGNQGFGGPCCLHLQGERSYHYITQCHNPEDLDLNFHRRENLRSHVLRMFGLRRVEATRVCMKWHAQSGTLLAFRLFVVSLWSLLFTSEMYELQFTRPSSCFQWTGRRKWLWFAPSFPTRSR